MTRVDEVFEAEVRKRMAVDDLKQALEIAEFITSCMRTAMEIPRLHKNYLWLKSRCDPGSSEEIRNSADPNALQHFENAILRLAQDIKDQFRHTFGHDMIQKPEPMMAWVLKLKNYNPGTCLTWREGDVVIRPDGIPVQLIRSEMSSSSSNTPPIRIWYWCEVYQNGMISELKGHGPDWVQPV